MTVRHGASLSYAPVRARCEREPELLALGPSYGLYAVLDFIVDNYLPIVDEFREELNELEQDIFSDTYHRDTVVKLYELKRELTRMRMAVAPSLPTIWANYSCRARLGFVLRVLSAPQHSVVFSSTKSYQKISHSMTMCRTKMN